MAADPPRSERWVRAGVAWLGRRWPRLVAVLAAAAAALWLAAGVYSVGNGETAALLRFGAYSGEPVASGLRFRWPGAERVRVVPTAEVRRLEIVGERMPELSILTGDENFIEARLVLQYRITGLGDYLFATEDAEELVAQAARAALIEAVARLPVDDVLTSGKAAIQNRVRSEAQGLLDRYRAGVTLMSVNLQSVDPPREAADAFRDVNDAKAEAARQVNDAESARERALSLARGRAAELQQEARTAADNRVQQARGAAGRFEEVLAQARRTPALTRQELYLRLVADTLPEVEIVTAPDSGDIEVNLLGGGARDESE